MYNAEREARLMILQHASCICTYVCKVLRNAIIVARSEVNIAVNTYFKHFCTTKMIMGFAFVLQENSELLHELLACLSSLHSFLYVFYLSNSVNSLLILAHWIC